MRHVAMLSLLALALSGPAAAGEAPAVKAEVETKDKADTRIYVKTAPPGARIAVDGKPVGDSPRLFAVPPGARTVTLTIELDGYEKEDRAVEVRGGRVTRLSFDLRKAEGAAPAAEPVKTEPKAGGRDAGKVAEDYIKAIAAGKLDEAFALIDPAVRASMDEEARRKEAAALAKDFDLSKSMLSINEAADRALAITDAIPARKGERECWLAIQLRSRAGVWSIVDVEEFSGQETLKRHIEDIETGIEAAIRASFFSKAAGGRDAGKVADDYIKAIAAGKLDEAFALIDPAVRKSMNEEARRNKAALLAKEFDLSKAEIELFEDEDGDRALAATRAIPARAGERKCWLAILVERRPAGWAIANVEELASMEARDRCVSDFQAGSIGFLAARLRKVREALWPLLRALKEQKVNEAIAILEPAATPEADAARRARLDESWLLDFSWARVEKVFLHRSGRACAVAGEITARKDGQKFWLGISLEEREGGHRILDVVFHPSPQDRDRWIDDFKSANPGAWALFSNGPRATAETFLWALGEGRVDDALAFARPELAAERGDMARTIERYDLSRAAVTTVLVTAQEARALTGEIPAREAGGSPAFLDIRLERAGDYWRVRGVGVLPSAGKGDEVLREFRAKHLDAAEDPPAAATSPAKAAPAAPAKAAPALEPRGARATARAFVKALGEGRIGDALAIDERANFDGLSKFVERFELSRTGITACLVAAGHGLAVTEEFRTRDGKEKGNLGLTLEKGWGGWRIRDVDFLPDAGKREEFVAEFRKLHPEAAEEHPPQPADRDIAAVAARFARAIVAGDEKAIEEFWMYPDPLDRDAGEAFLAVLGKARAAGGPPPRLEVVHIAPIGENRFAACFYEKGIRLFSPDDKAIPWFVTFEAVEGSWRTEPIPGLRMIVEAREGSVERIARRNLASSLIAIRFRGIDDLIAGTRAQAAAMEALAGPPYGMEIFKGAGESLRKRVPELEAVRGRPWPEVARKLLEEMKGRTDGIAGPELIVKDFGLLFYLPAHDGEAGAISLPFPAENRTLAVEEWPCFTEEFVAEASVGEDPQKHPVVNVRLTRGGEEIFAAVTRNNVLKRLAIVFEGKVISAPTIRSAIAGGKMEISGVFLKEEAEGIAAKLNAHREKIRGFLRELREKGIPPTRPAGGKD